MLYPFRLYKSECDRSKFWVAESTSLKGCVGQGDTKEEACSELEENEKAWIKAAKAYGIAVPTMPVKNTLSLIENDKSAHNARRES